MQTQGSRDCLRGEVGTGFVTSAGVPSCARTTRLGMKANGRIWLLAALCAWIALVGCDRRSAHPLPEVVHLYGGVDGAAYDLWLDELVRDLDQQGLADVRFEVVNTAGSVENLLRVQSESQSLALVQADIAGRRPQAAAGQAQDELLVRALNHPFSECMYLVAPQQIRHLDGGLVEVVSIGHPGSGTAFTFGRLLEAWSNLVHFRGETLSTLAGPGGGPPSALGELDDRVRPAEGTVLALADRRAQVAFRVSRTAQPYWRVGPDSRRKLLAMPDGLQRRAMLDNPEYELGRVGVGEEAVPTLMVRTLLIANRDLHLRASAGP